MYNLNQFYAVLESLAPIRLSQQAVSQGDYDNSGILVGNHDQVKKVLFSLDLSDLAVKRAISLGVDTIVTHHPAIYMPLKNLTQSDPQQAPLLTAIARGKNVISMHLNLDFAKDGIDQSLAVGLGGEKVNILQPYSQENEGYGREFSIAPVTLAQFVKNAKKTFGTDKIICYGNKNQVVNSVASFCGGGSSHAVDCVQNKLTNAEVIVSSDFAHHNVTALVQSGKAVVVIPHYASENYGFKRYFQNVKNTVGENLSLFYFEDKRYL